MIWDQTGLQNPSAEFDFPIPCQDLVYYLSMKWLSKMFGAYYHAISDGRKLRTKIGLPTRMRIFIIQIKLMDLRRKYRWTPEHKNREYPREKWQLMVDLSKKSCFLRSSLIKKIRQ